jgi:Flp pilus assembly protein TadD
VLAGVLLLSVLATLAGCAGGPRLPFSSSEIKPLSLSGKVLTPADALAMVPERSLLALTPEMEAFVERYAGEGSQRSRLLSLHQAVKSPALLGIEYDPFAQGTAAEVFQRGTANCLGYAHLFIALARAAGLSADYQWMELRPEWSRLGERVAVRLHVNVRVRLPRGEKFMVDIDPLEPYEIAHARPISDREALALHYSNEAILSLSEGDLEKAWLWQVRAVMLSPGTPHLWVNLGAVYRQADDPAAAEQSYFRALALDDRERSAINNLVVLYSSQGRDTERAYWVERLDRYRQQNPYYHAWLGDRAGERENWQQALAHYRRAVELQPDDSNLIYAVGLLHYRLDDYDAATVWITRAIDAASFRDEQNAYQVQLRAVERAAALAAN